MADGIGGRGIDPSPNPAHPGDYRLARRSRFHHGDPSRPSEDRRRVSEVREEPVDHD